MRLTAKIMLIVLATVMLATGLAGYFSIRTAYREFQQRQQAMAEQIHAQLGEKLVQSWQRDGMAGVLALLEQAHRQQSGRFEMRWVWFEPNAPDAQKPHGAPGNWTTTLMSGKIVSLTTRDPRGTARLHTYLPLQVVPNRSGGLEISESLAALERQTRRTIWTSIVSIGGVAMACVAVTYLAGMRWVARPLEALIAKTERIGKGDFSQPLKLAGTDEFGQLADAINEMCQKLGDQQSTIQAETAQRLATLEQLRHADRLKTVGRLAAGLAHELGTPLNVVAGRASLIASGKLSPSEINASAQTIKTEADRITSIVRQLLDFARRTPARRMPTEINELLGRTLELLQPLAEKQGTSFQFQRSAEPAVANVDGSQIQQVLTNLLVNAIHATPAGGTIRIQVQAAAPAHAGAGAESSCSEGRASASTMVDGGRLSVAITDQGPGVADDIRQQIFEPFFTTKDVGEGTGLGLSIAYGIVEEHGGRIEVCNEPGGGATFRIELPQEQPS